MTHETHQQTTQENGDRPTACASLFEMARTHVCREQTRTENERDAFRAFKRKLGEIKPHTGTTTVGVPAVQAATTGSDDALEAVESAYRSTVMSVPHYETEYDETYAEHLAGEFTPDIATILTDGPRFESHHRQAVIAGAEDAAASRDDLLGEIESELASLEESAGTICSIDEEVSDIEDLSCSTLSFGALEGYYTRLETLEAKCTNLLETRQSTLVTQRRRISLPIDAPDIAVYVYQDLPVNYPVVSTIARLLDRIESQQTAINQAIYE